jgi:hypothetical protein
VWCQSAPLTQEITRSWHDRWLKCLQQQLSSVPNRGRKSLGPSTGAAREGYAGAHRQKLGRAGQSKSVPPGFHPAPENAVSFGLCFGLTQRLEFPNLAAE